MASAMAIKPSTSGPDSELGNFGPSGTPSTAWKVIVGPRRDDPSSRGTGTGGGCSFSNLLTRSSFRAARRGVPSSDAQWCMTR